MIHEVLAQVHHVTLAGILFRSFRHGDYNVLALKQLYANSGLLPAEDADLELVKVSTVEEMCTLLSGPSHIACGPYEVGVPPESAKGDSAV